MTADELQELINWAEAEKQKQVDKYTASIRRTKNVDAKECMRTECDGVVIGFDIVIEELQRRKEELEALARKPLISFPKGEYIVVPMPVDADGLGPEMDASKVVKTYYLVWDGVFHDHASFDNREDAEKRAKELNEQAENIHAIPV